MVLYNFNTFSPAIIDFSLWTSKDYKCKPEKGMVFQSKSPEVLCVCVTLHLEANCVFVLLELQTKVTLTMSEKQLITETLSNMFVIKYNNKIIITVHLHQIPSRIYLKKPLQV